MSTTASLRQSRSSTPIEFLGVKCLKDKWELEKLQVVPNSQAGFGGRVLVTRQHGIADMWRRLNWGDAHGPRSRLRPKPIFAERPKLSQPIRVTIAIAKSTRQLLGTVFNHPRREGIPLGNDHASVIVSAQLKLSRQSLRLVSRQFRAQYLGCQLPTSQTDCLARHPHANARSVMPGIWWG
jgi:hypothetical protein